jgi:hypothetical protein
MKLLEYVPDVDWDRVRGNFQLIDSLLSLMGRDSDGFGFTVAGVRVRFGQSTVHWNNGANLSDLLSGITHGLGRTPIVIVANEVTGSGADLVMVQTFTYSATTFSIRGRFMNSAVSAGAADLTVGWVAIG